MKYLEHHGEVAALCTLIALVASIDWLVSVLVG
jgi:hypothetical protein